MVGKLELSRAIAMPILAITMLQLRTVQVTDAQSLYSFSEYLGTRLFMTILGILVFILIAFCLYRGETAWIILFWGVAKSVDSISDIIRSLFQKYECMNLSAISFIIKGLATLATMAPLLFFTGKLTTSIYGVCFVWLLVLVLYDLPQAYRLLSRTHISDKPMRYIIPCFHAKTISSLLWLTLPLGMVVFLNSLQISIPKLILEHYYGEAALGYFGPLVYPMVIGTMVIMAMAQSASPRLANYYINNLSSYCRLVKKLFLLGLAMGIVLIVAVIIFGKYALRFLYTAEYVNYHTDLIILSIGAAISFILSFCGYALTAARVFKVQFLIAIVSCLMTIPIAFLLIWLYGIRGAVLTSVLAFTVTLIVSFTALLWVIHKRRGELEINNEK